MMDRLAKTSLCGTVLNVPEGMVPESDTANIAVLSYDPKIYSKGRSPLEAVSMGLKMRPDDTAYRCNVVTVSENEENYDDKIMLDHSADEISTAEASELIRTMEEHFGTDMRHFYTGVSYRHCMIWNNTPSEYNFMRPHDILGRKIKDYLPQGEAGKPFYELMKASYDVLNHHPINEARRARGLRPANSIWLWSPGKKPALPNFYEKWGIRGAVISAVDLIKGIGICVGLKSINVEGATGNIHTNWSGKADAAIEAFENEYDFVYIHVEAPDECGHRAELDNKILSIEKIDDLILKPVYNYLVSTGNDFNIMVLPDHPTPVAMRTHSSDPVPFMIYSSKKKQCGVDCFTEDSCIEKNFYIDHGYNLLSYMIENKK
jgi:2,3-bisphosphoglycerate-independent phosphoglycerate mutase